MKIQLRAHSPGTARRLELVKAQAEGDADTLYVYGIIGQDFWGDGVSALDFAQAVRQSTASALNLRINSPGGDVFEGVAMAQALRDFKGQVTAYVDGIAASAATFLTNAADSVLMAKGARMMIHEASSGAWGNAQDFLDMAALLEGIDADIAQQYADKAGMKPDEARALMKATTWYTAAQAVESGLADGMQGDEADDGKAENRARLFNLDAAFRNVPDALKSPLEPEPKPEPTNAAPETFPEFDRVQRLARLI